MAVECGRIPLPLADFWSYGIKYTNTRSVFEDGLGLPKTVDFYTDNGQPVFRYRATESTNVLGWTFPLRFELAQYRNEYGRGPWELNLTASGIVTSIGVGRPPQIPTEAQRAIEKNSGREDGAGPDVSPLILGSAAPSGTEGAESR